MTDDGAAGLRGIDGLVKRRKCNWIRDDDGDIDD